MQFLSFTIHKQHLQYKIESTSYLLLQSEKERAKDIAIATKENANGHD